MKSFKEFTEALAPKSDKYYAVKKEIDDKEFAKGKMTPAQKYEIEKANKKREGNKYSGGSGYTNPRARA